MKMKGKIAAAVIAVLSASSCTSDRDKAMLDRGTKYDDRFILVRDVHNRCLQLDLHVSVSGSEFSQSGDVKARQLTDDQCNFIVEYQK